MKTSAPRFTVDVIEQALEQGLAVITLMQLRDALQSGEVAILTKAERETALLRMGYSEMQFWHGRFPEATSVRNEARTILQLP